VQLPPSLSTIVDEIAGRGRGVVMTMGKGGVGKTSIASAIAVDLARRGHRVHLSTTDPAAHVDASLADAVPGLEVSRIDPEVETCAYRDEVMSTAGGNLDQQGKDLLREDLRSPCTEEIAVFRAFARKVEQGEDGFVVLDTAPTGHTLLLLDATEAYHREVLRSMSDLPDSVRHLLPRLRDPDFTKVLIVTLPEASPVHEASMLEADLLRAGIRPFAWVINQSLAALSVEDPVLSARREREFRYIEEVQRARSSRVALVPWTEDASSFEAWLSELVGRRGEAEARRRIFAAMPFSGHSSGRPLSESSVADRRPSAISGRIPLFT
jgi:arsenite-transporting ATPase